jgi:hypothetical protein
LCCTHPYGSIREIPGLRPLQSLVSEASWLSICVRLFGAKRRAGPTAFRQAAFRASTLLTRAKSDLLRYGDFSRRRCIAGEVSRSEIGGIAAKRRESPDRSGTRSGRIKKASKWGAAKQGRAKLFARG